MSLWSRLLLEGSPRRDDVRRVIILVAVAILCSLLVVDLSSAPPSEDLVVGDVATRTVTAPFDFRYLDQTARERAVDEARTAVPPVFVYRGDLAVEMRDRIGAAFANARSTLQSIVLDDGDSPVELELGLRAASLGPQARTDLSKQFREDLGVRIPDSDVRVLLDDGFSPEAESLAGELLMRAMRGYVVADRDELPSEAIAIRVIEMRGGDQEETVVRDLERISTPADARQQVAIGVIDLGVDPGQLSNAVSTVVRASVRPNLAYDHLQTEQRRQEAASQVPVEPVTVKRGATLFRSGDVLTEQHLLKYKALQSSRTDQSLWVELLTISLFLAMLLASLYHFGASFMPGFTRRVRDVATVGFLVLLTTLLARITVALSPFIAGLLGAQAEAESVWFLLPMAGAAMLVRLLLGVSWTVIFVIVASSLAGLVMDLRALPVVFFLLSGLVAAGTVEHTRERAAVVRAGLFTGVVNAAAVLLMHFLQLFLADDVVSMATTMRPVWSMGFAFLGGVLSVPLVLGLVPLFEGMGFVTDYRLMELANLNHPLLRQLMLRAPGSYHHSVLVGSLAEAACQAVGGNALQVRVAAYFHDVGKSLKPQYYVENQRDAPNRHDSLDPWTSSRIIISHVTEGARLAREHGLPAPIIDNVYMHHGTGLLRFFHSKALTEADDPATVDEATFRYPGPKPDTREAGILMLADKVEAATRTIRHPSEENFRAMIGQIVNSVMADGQFENCPLTFREIYSVADTFVDVLMGVYHQRIEYPDTADISSGVGPEAPASKVPPVKSSQVITLDIPSQRPSDTPAVDLEEEEEDYESVEHLPRGGEG